MSDEIQNLKNDGMITEDDKLWGAISLAIGIVGLIMLFIPDKGNRPFIRYAAIHGIALSVVGFVLSTIIGFIPIVQCISPIIGLGIFGYGIYLAVTQTYNGEYAEVPYLTDFIKEQGWDQITG